MEHLRIMEHLHIDDDVAGALYSRDRMVPTQTQSQVTPLKNK